MAGNLLASPSDLCLRLGEEVPEVGSTAYKQMEALLDDASGEVMAVIGQPVAKATSTVTLYPDASSTFQSFIDLPARPVHAVHKVVIDGQEITRYRVRYLTLSIPRVSSDEPVEVTFTHGYEVIPPELTKWTCMLAAAQLASSESTHSLGMVAGTSQQTVTIDDFTEGWANYTGNKIPGLSLPPDVQARLRATYGMGGIESLMFR